MTFEEADECHACGFAFSFFARRHHCRECGRSVCHDHSRRTRPLPHRGAGAEPLRVCDGCDARLAAALEVERRREEAEVAAKSVIQAAYAKGLLLAPADVALLEGQGIADPGAVAALTDADLRLRPRPPRGGRAR